MNTMTNQHPITPPPKLAARWKDNWFDTKIKHINLEDYILAQAAQWGADQELEACCEVLARELICDGKHVATDLRMIRRPKPPSLKEQAIKDLDDLEVNLKDFGMGFVPITNLRKALEALPND
jgi:hypothetical protein